MIPRYRRCVDIGTKIGMIIWKMQYSNVLYDNVYCIISRATSRWQCKCEDDVPDEIIPKISEEIEEYEVVSSKCIMFIINSEMAAGHGKGRIYI